MHAMTIHKSQGSQADEVTALMPSEDSRLLTRELFYTAVTRAKGKVRVVGSDVAVRLRSNDGRCGRRDCGSDCGNNCFGDGGTALPSEGIFNRVRLGRMVTN